MLKLIEEMRFQKKNSFKWKENRRRYNLFCKENATGNFILCSVTYADGKRQTFFSEGKGLIEGWALLAKALRALCVNTNSEKEREHGVSKNQRKGETSIRGVSRDLSFPKITKNRGKKQETVCLDVSDCMPRGELGTLKYCLVGRWKMRLDPFLLLQELESWAKVVWRLKGHVIVALLNQDLLYLEFSSQKEAKWVLKNRKKILKGNALHLEWWNLSVDCACKKDQAKEAWIRVVGLPLHLWTREIQEKLGGCCGDFLVMDKGTTLRRRSCGQES